jgi:hypothetical protein
MHKPYFKLKHLLEILGDKISSNQTPDEINSLRCLFVGYHRRILLMGDPQPEFETEVQT